MSSSPMFFRMVLQRNLDDPKLMIPKMFTKEHGKLLSSSVILKLPDGRKWKVGLTTADNGAVWLQEGWDKFSEHYCVESGFLLVFKLLDGRGISSFKVNIFDTTAMETQYCCNVNDITEEFDSDSDASSESFRPHSKKRKKGSVPRRRLSKKTRKEDLFVIKSEPEEEEGCNNFSDIPKEEVLISRRREELKNNKIASTTNPFFKVQIHKKSYRNAAMNIPMAFANEHFSPEIHYAKLRVRDKEWEVTLKQYVNHCRFSAGWSKFYHENKLRDGNTCLFEMVSKKNCIFKVSIFTW